MPSGTNVSPLLLCEDDFAKRVFGWPHAALIPRETCAGCECPIMIEKPFEVKASNREYGQTWHRSCYGIFKAWGVKPPIPPCTQSKDSEAFDSDCLLWEDRVHTIWMVCSEFAAAFNRSQADLLHSLHTRDWRAAVTDGSHLLAVMDALLSIVEEMGSPPKPSRLLTERRAAKKAVADYMTEFQAFMTHTSEVGQEGAEKLKSVLSRTEHSVSILTKGMVAWFMQRGVHSGDIDVFILKVELLSRAQLSWQPGSFASTSMANYFSKQRRGSLLSWYSFQSIDDDHEDPSEASPADLQRMVSSWSLGSQAERLAPDDPKKSRTAPASGPQNVVRLEHHTQGIKAKQSRLEILVPHHQDTIPKPQSVHSKNPSIASSHADSAVEMVVDWYQLPPCPTVAKPQSSGDGDINSSTVADQQQQQEQPPKHGTRLNGRWKSSFLDGIKKGRPLNA
ncbi:hypothetical protein HK104_008445 [Borealophlyctis nickersoniae]|nr:hypothetical protein HK104_008445 [Borealophlyctis nickersoniae]